MLSIGKLGAGKADYYLKSVAQGIEDYYTGAGEAPGWWTGSAADEMEVFGQVEGELLHRALAGQHPKTGGQLAHAGAIRVPGYDLTFSAPKSVSLLFGLGGADIGRQVRDAHDAAVQAALGYMERQCAVGRRGRGGTVSVMGNGFLAAAFRHRTSRAGDPQLHTHVLVSNMTRGPDGRWTALDARRLYAHAKTGGCLYQAQLRAELTRRLGVQWTQVRNGQAEIAGFASQVLRGFSRRRSEVTQRMEQRGEQSSKAAEMAALDTRRAKDYSVDGQTLADGWARRAAQLGLDPADLLACLSRVQAHTLDEQQAEQVQDRLAGPDGLTAHQSSFTRRDVIRAWCDQLQEGADVEVIEDLADEFLRSDRAVSLITDAQGLAGTDVIRRQDGRIVPSAPEGRSYSTPELLQIERTTIDRAVSSAKAHAGVVDAAIVQAAIERRPTLSDEQVAMVRSLCLDGNGVQVIVGKGGTGKTFAMDAAREAWQAGGYRVIGAALARRAAYELRDGTGIESTSVTALLADLRNRAGETGVIEAGRAVLVIDEAGMVGTRQLAEIISFAEGDNAKVVLLGDTHQLPEIHAGGLFRGLAVRLTPIILTENRRQHEAWERQALDLLRHGQAEQALSRYQEHGRLVIDDSADGVRQRMIADWWQAREEGTDTVMIALRRDDVRDLNGRARALMAATGRLGSESIEIAGRDFAVGDEIVTLANNRRLDVLNGTRATVVGVDIDRRQLHIHTTDDREVTLPADYLDPPDDGPGKARVDHAYAITGHKAQGMTTGTVLVLGTEDLYREWGYTALSRGQHNNRLYLTLPEPSEREEFAPSDPNPRGPLQRTVAALQRSRAQVLAIDAAYAQQFADTPTRELLGDFDRLHARLASARDGMGRRRRLDQLERQRQAAEHAAEDAQAHLQALQAEDPREHSMDLARETAAVQQARERAEALHEQAHALAGADAADALPSADDMERYLALRSELSRRREGHGHLLALEPPTYLTAAIGPVPERIGARRQWKRMAVEIESYRERHAIDDQSHALGPQPTDLRQRAAWRELHERLDRLARSLEGPQRDVDRSLER